MDQPGPDESVCPSLHAKVENLTSHDLRGEAGSQLLEAGVPIHEVSDALGPTQNEENVIDNNVYD